MRKFLLSLIVLILCLMPVSTVAFADSPEIQPANEYYMLKKDVLFGIPNALFDQVEYKCYLPNSYYVKVGNQKDIVTVENKTFKSVIYNGIEGYIELDTENKSYVLIEDETTLNKLNDDTAYLNDTLELKVDYTLPSSKTINAHEKLNLIGTYSIAAVPQYVFYIDNEFVYIPATDVYFNDYQIKKHTFPQDINSNVVIDNDSKKPYNNLETNLLTIGIGVLCVVMIIIMFYPRKQYSNRNNRDDNYYDEYKSTYDARNNRR